ncbi:GNAT family N-acetyltransferase [Halorussus salilacus]|uniref:GNAT family N-acetyltransferase n=1 Tax=Halorussus salilacus TaxID=2953750 RepID=UPI00209E2DEE|nr:GNAT family N-acetyltransferase [Halorussus salilacus]USZ69587.1 GNAT family N-acetyltransferase [Halorussus salilacus]
MSVRVREATPGDRLGIRRVLDAAMLEVGEDLSERIAAGDALVASEARSAGRDEHSRAAASVARGDASERRAVEPRGDEDAGQDRRDAPILGALVLVPLGRTRDSDRRGVDARVDAVAVRRSRRGRGIGAELVRTAAERHPRLTAEFDPNVRPFYESLGFEVAPVGGEESDRLRGVLETEG